MSRALDLQISALDHILSNRLVDAETAEALSGAKGSLQFLQANEEFIREAVAERRKFLESTHGKAMRREFPDAEITAVRRME